MVIKDDCVDLPDVSAVGSHPRRELRATTASQCGWEFFCFTLNKKLFSFLLKLQSMSSRSFFNSIFNRFNSFPSHSRSFLPLHPFPPRQVVFYRQWPASALQQLHPIQPVSLQPARRVFSQDYGSQGGDFSVGPFFDNQSYCNYWMGGGYIRSTSIWHFPHP